jgi:hypothetical protein
LFNDLGFQLTGQYESPRVLPQGKRLEEYSADFAMKKDLFKKDKRSLTFSINDVFNTRRYGLIYDTDEFYQESFRRPRARTFRITFSYKFGNVNFSLFNKKRDNRTPGEE